MNVIFHNIDKTDPNADTATGEWVARLGYSLVNISGGEAFAYAMAGVPVLQDVHELSLIQQGFRGAEAKANEKFWDDALAAQNAAKVGK